MWSRTKNVINQLQKTNTWKHVLHDHNTVFLNCKKDINGLLDNPLCDSSILVLGCGYMYSDVILFSSNVRSVIGLDLLRAFYRDGLLKTYREYMSRENQFFGAIVKVLLQRYGGKKYYHNLEKISGVQVEHTKYQLISYNGKVFPFEDESFHAVLSNSVLQEIDSLENLFRELHRVTKRGGVSYHLWHNYYSYSGGYVPEIIADKYPWGHLRGKYQTRGLNRMRRRKSS